MCGNISKYIHHDDPVLDQSWMFMNKWKLYWVVRQVKRVVVLSPHHDTYSQDLWKGAPVMTKDPFHGGLTSNLLSALTKIWKNHDS